MNNSIYKPNQIEAANNIYNSYINDSTRHIIMVSDLQAGKTGTYNKVIDLALNNNLVEKVYVISGSNEILLKNQAISDLKVYNLGLIAKCTVYFRQDFHKIEDFNNTLIVIDESHLDQTVKQQMFQLMEKHQLTMTGNKEPLIQKKSYILSVSATPFSEVSDLLNGKSDVSKKMIRLIPGEGYRGVEYFYKNNLIKSIFDIEINIDKFKNLILSNGNKYNIIRILSKPKLVDFIVNNLSNICNIYFYDASPKSSIFLTNEERFDAGITSNIPTLEISPCKPSIILIKGRLRVGKVLPKNNIGFVWENSTDANTDTILQGLLGRCCGYHTRDIEIYISESLLQKSSMNKSPAMNEIERYITKGFIPMKGCNLKTSSRLVNVETNTKKVNPIPTEIIKIHFDNTTKTNDGDYEYDILFKNNNAVKKRSIIYDSLMRNDFEVIRESCINPGQIDEVIEIIKTQHRKQSENSSDSESTTLRYYKGKQYLSNDNLRKLVESHKLGFGNRYTGNHGKQSTKHDDIIVSLVCPGYEGLINVDAIPGDVFIFFYTVNSSLFISESTTALSQRIPSTNKQEIFIHHDDITDVLDLSLFTNNIEEFKTILENNLKTKIDSIKNIKYNKKYSIDIFDTYLPIDKYFETNDYYRESNNDTFWNIIKDFEQRYNIKISVNIELPISAEVKFNCIQWNFIKNNLSNDNNGDNIAEQPAKKKIKIKPIKQPFLLTTDIIPTNQNRVNNDIIIEDIHIEDIQHNSNIEKIKNIDSINSIQQYNNENKYEDVNFNNIQTVSEELSELSIDITKKIKITVKRKIKT